MEFKPLATALNTMRRLSLPITIFNKDLRKAAQQAGVPVHLVQ